MNRRSCASGNRTGYLRFKHQPAAHWNRDRTCDWRLAIGCDHLGNPPAYTVQDQPNGTMKELTFLAAGSLVLDAPGQLLVQGDIHRLGQPLCTYSLGKTRLFVLTATRWGCAAPGTCECGAATWSRADERWLRLQTPDRLDLHVWNGNTWMKDPWSQYRELFHPTNHGALRLDLANTHRCMPQDQATGLAQRAIGSAADDLRGGLPDCAAAQSRIELLDLRWRWYAKRIEDIEADRDMKIRNLVAGPMLAANRGRFEKEAAKAIEPHVRSKQDVQSRIDALRLLTDDRRGNLIPCVRTWWVATS